MIVIMGMYSLNTHAAEKKVKTKMKQVNIISKLDGSLQPAVIQSATGNEPRPLLVALHTWSSTYKSKSDAYSQLCREKNWHLIHPDFRGPNWNPEACGSSLVVSDLEDAVEYMRKNFAVDEKRIYLLGGSGGGHCALLMAGRRPDLFCAVSAWCPINDIALWHKQCKARSYKYDEHIEISCGGDPGSDPAAKREAAIRSPKTWLPNAVNKVPVDISTGIHDGHTGSVPVGHAIRAYNLLAAEADRISEADIEYIEKFQRVPEHLAAKESDPAYGEYTVYLRKVSNHVRLTLFEGGHNIFPEISGDWLERQSSGTAPDFAPGKAQKLEIKELAK